MGRGKIPHNLGRQLRPDWGGGRMWWFCPSYFVWAKSVRRIIISREHIGFTQKKRRGNRVSHTYIDDGRHIGEREAVLCDQGDLSRQRRLQALLQGIGGGMPTGVAAMRGLAGEFLLPPLKKKSSKLPRTVAVLFRAWNNLAITNTNITFNVELISATTDKLEADVNLQSSCLYHFLKLFFVQYFGSPIECDFDGSVNGDLAKQYCWVHGSFWIKPDYQDDFDCR